MTHKHFLDSVAELAKDIEALINDRAKRFCNSGAVDFDSYENDYRLPKTFIAAMSTTIEAQYSPMSWDKLGRKDLKNIKHFI